MFIKLLSAGIALSVVKAPAVVLKSEGRNLKPGPGGRLVLPVGLSHIWQFDLSRCVHVDASYWMEPGDGGEVSLFRTGRLTRPGKQPITEPYGTFGDAAGNEFAVVAIGPVPAAAFGIIPDAFTDYRAKGHWAALLQFASRHGCRVDVLPGEYACALDNRWSNVHIHSHPGAIFWGTIHYAVNDKANKPRRNRPSNVKFTGVWSTYARIGAFNADNAYLEEGVILDDPSRNIIGVRGGGVHLYQQCYGHRIDKLTIHSSDRDYGFGCDATRPDFACRDVRIGKVIIKNSHTHGALVAGDCSIDELVVENFGDAPDRNTTKALPLFTSWSPDYCFPRGLAIGDTWTGRIGRAVIKGGTGVGCECLNRSENSMIDSLEISSVTRRGLLNRGNLSARRIRLSGNGERGVSNYGSIDCDDVREA